MVTRRHTLAVYYVYGTVEAAKSRRAGYQSGVIMPIGGTRCVVRHARYTPRLSRVLYTVIFFIAELALSRTVTVIRHHVTVSDMVVWRHFGYTGMAAR